MYKRPLKNLLALSKSLLLVAIYLLPVLFVDDAMAVNNNSNTAFKQFTNQQSSHHEHSATDDYRMLLKNETAKQAQINFPDNIDFTSVAIHVLTSNHVTQPQFGTLLHLNAYAFKLYRLFRVFLI